MKEEYIDKMAEDLAKKGLLEEHRLYMSSSIENVYKENLMSFKSHLEGIAKEGLEYKTNSTWSDNKEITPDEIVARGTWYLDAKREGIERLKKDHEQSLKKEREAEIINDKFQRLDEMREFLRGCPACEYCSYDQIMALASDKAQQKNVTLFESKEQPTKGIKRLFMSKKEKQAEAKRIEEKKKAYENANKFINQFASKYQNDPIIREVNSFKLAQELWADAYSAKESYDGGKFVYFDKEKNAYEISEFEKLEALYKPAQEKIQSQLHEEVQLKQTARETSGVKDIENNTGVDILSLKEEIRNNAPSGKDMSSKELYQAMMKMRGLGKATEHSSSKQDFSQSTIDLKQIRSNEEHR